MTSTFINPFEGKDLISLTSGLSPSEEVISDLLSAHEKGEKAMNAFVKERLVDQKTGFFEPLSRFNLGTFTKLKTSSVKTKSGQVVQFSEQSAIFGKIAIIQQTRSFNLKEVFCYPVPWALSTSTGELVKTNKAAFMHEVEKETPTEKVNPMPYATIIDGMALVRKQKTKGKTFESFADEMIASVIESNQSSKRIDIVFDVYLDSSIMDL